MSAMTTKTATATERIAGYVAGLRFEDVPPAVIERTKERLVHHLGLALRENGPRARHDAGRLGIRVACELSRAGGDTSIIGRREKVSAIDAAYANSALMGGMDDGVLPGGCHPGVVTIPVALAVAEHAGSTGRELLIATLLGYDVMCKLAAVAFTWTAPLPRPPNQVFAPLGVAAAAARLMGSSSEQTALALAHAANASMGIVEASAQPFGLYTYPLLARNGLMAATMARAATPMAANMVEGPGGLYRSFFGTVPDGLDAALAAFGRDFEVARSIIKRDPDDGLNLLATERAIAMVNEHHFGPSDIASVTLALPVERRAREDAKEREYRVGGRPSAAARFLVAVALTDGRLNADRYATAPAPDLAGVLDAVRIVYEEGHPILYMRLEVDLRDGRRLVAERDAWGDAQFIFPRAEWGAWLRECGAGVISAAQIVRLERTLADLDRIDDVRELNAWLCPES
jgi:2-methylcitrate dehydratase PrpD